MTSPIPAVRLQGQRWSFRLHAAAAAACLGAAAVCLLAPSVPLALLCAVFAAAFAVLAQAARARLWRAYWIACPDGARSQMRAWLKAQPPGAEG